MASTSVSYSTGWYEVKVDWLTTNAINVTVYNANGTVFATVGTTSSTYVSGGMGFSFWGQHGGWDFYSGRKYIFIDPTYIFGVKQGSDGATWKAAEDTPLSGLSTGTNVRLRFSVQNSGPTVFGKLFRLQYASKGASLNCESVADVSYNDVPKTSTGCGSDPVCMTTSSQFADGADTSPSLSYPASMNFTNGKIMEDGKVRPLDVKVGDKILFGKYSGTEVKVGNEELLVMREEDIMGVVEK